MFAFSGGLAVEDAHVAMALSSCCHGSEPLTLLHTERPKLYAILAFLSATGLMAWHWHCCFTSTVNI